MEMEISEREYRLLKVFREHSCEFLESLNKVIKDPCDTDRVQESQEHRLAICG